MASAESAVNTGFFELVMQMRQAQRRYKERPSDKLEWACRQLEVKVDEVLIQRGYIHRLFRLPSGRGKDGDGTVVCEIVKCKLGNWWQLNVRNKNGRVNRYSNIKDFPLRKTYQEVKQDVANYIAKVEERKQRWEAAKAAGKYTRRVVRSEHY